MANEKPKCFGFYDFCEHRKETKNCEYLSECVKPKKDSMSISGKFGCLGLHDYCSEDQRKNCHDLKDCIQKTEERQKQESHHKALVSALSEYANPWVELFDPKCLASYDCDYQISGYCSVGKDKCPMKLGEDGFTPSYKEVVNGKIEVRRVFPYNPIGSFHRGDPFSITFVYPSKSKPFILKGGINSIEKWLLTYEEPCIIHYTYWRAGKSRTSITLKNLLVPVLMYEQNWYPELWKLYNIDKRKHWAILIRGIGACSSFDNPVYVVATMKRLPRKWIKELNPYIDQKYVKQVPYAKASDRPRAKEDYRMIRIEE